MRVLIYVGYQSIHFNPDTLKETGLGGTEIALIYLANELKKFGHKIIVSGDVLTGTFDSIEWLPTNECHRKYSNQFDIIIAASYLHVVPEFKEYVNAKTILWVHNTDYYPWWQGEEIENHLEILNSNSINTVVCLTEWHRELWHKKYGNTNIEVIGNGIDTSTFIGQPEKIKNRFIWSSAPERGLYDLLNNWQTILKVKPGATLEVFSPSYSIDQLDNSSEIKTLLEQTGIIVRGNVSQEELHTAMLRAEYWMYLTDYEETYCITALEMQYAKVLPIVTEVAALAETVSNGIILENSETKWQESVQLLSKLGPELKDKVTEEAYQWAKMQTWSERSYIWNELLHKIC